MERISRKTAQQIVETVKDVCGQNINYIGTDGMILASTDRSRIDQFHEVGLQAAKGGETIEVETDNAFYGTLAGVNIPIVFKGEVIAVIGISGIPEEVRKYAYLAQRITVLLLREQDLDRRESDERTLTNYVIRSLLDEDKCQSSRVKNYLAEKQINEDARYHIICINIEKRYHPNNLGMIEHVIYQTFRKMHTNLYTFNYPNEYVALVKTGDLAGNRNNLDKLVEEYGNFLCVGISEGHDLKEQYCAYEEANIALRHADRQKLCDYRDLGIEMLTNAIDSKVEAAFTKKFLHNLTEEEIAFLRVYYEADMSLAETGKELFLHKNTIQYKLDKIHRKTGYNPRKFRDAVGFYTAIQL